MKLKILTPLYVNKETSSIWSKFTLVERHAKINFLSDYLLAFKMFNMRNKFDVVITDSDRIGNIFAIMQLFTRKRIIHIMKDCLWSYKNNTILNIFKRIQLLIESKTVTKFVVYSKSAVDYFSEFTGIDREKFVSICFHSTLERYVFDIKEGDYLFAGGNGNRDYEILINAVRDLNINVFIATSNKDMFNRKDIPSNVEVRNVSSKEFLKKMAGAKIIVVPLKYNKLHCGGEQTFLNAMTMAKPTIVTNNREAKDYIEDGNTGFLVEPGNSQKLREKIEWILNYPEKSAEIGKSGQKFAAPLNTECWHKKLYDLAERLCDERKN